MQGSCITRRIVLVVPLLALCASAGAQRDLTPTMPAPAPRFELTDNRAEPADEVVMGLFPIKHAQPAELCAVLELFARDRVSMAFDSRLRMLIVSGSQADIDRMSGALLTLDKPAKNIELTVYVLRGASEGPEGAALPVAIEPTVTRLRETFPYTLYTLVDTLVLRTRAGEQVSANDAAMLDGTRLSQTVQATVGLTEEDGNRVVRLDEFSFQAHAILPEQAVPAGTPPPPPPPPRPARPTSVETSFLANLDVPEGRSSLVGTAGLGKENSNLFVIVVPRVVEGE